MRTRWVYVNGEAIEADKYVPCEPDTPFVFGDIKPYRSTITGEMITSRSKHRDHLREHRMVELGNDCPIPPPDYKPQIPDAAPQQRKELIRSQVDAMTEREFKAALKRDIDRVKWNSNY